MVLQADSEGPLGLEEQDPQRAVETVSLGSGEEASQQARKSGANTGIASSESMDLPRHTGPALLANTRDRELEVQPMTHSVRHILEEI